MSARLSGGDQRTSEPADGNVAADQLHTSMHRRILTPQANILRQDKMRGRIWIRNS
jgi:hypothetical protein